MPVALGSTFRKSATNVSWFARCHTSAFGKHLQQKFAGLAHELVAQRGGQIFHPQRRADVLILQGFESSADVIEQRLLKLRQLVSRAPICAASSPASMDLRKSLNGLPQRDKLFRQFRDRL